MENILVGKAEWLPASKRKALEASVRSLMAENRVTLERRWNSPQPVACTYHAPSWEKPHLSHFITGAWEVHYPHQWFWDSCAHAVILASVDPALAQEEVRSLLYAQQPNGFIPHLAMHPGHRHSLGVALGRLGRSRHRSPYLQPPLLAESLAHIYVKTQDRAFLAEVLPRAVMYYDYIHSHRCPSGDGLAEIIISYESGMDRSPEYDSVYGKSTGAPMWRAPIIGLMLHHWRLRHDLVRILASQRFRVKDLLFNCIYARNQRVLARLLEAAGDRSRAGVFRERADTTEAAILSKMQSRETGLFHSLDARQGRDTPVPVVTLSAFMPLLLDTIGRSQVERLVERLTDSAAFWTAYPVPTQPLSAAAVTPRGHVIWRGLQTWILPNWLIYAGLKLQAERFPGLAQELSRTAEDIARRSYELVRQHGFREYYHSQTGEPGGAVHFAWSGLVWDMVQQH
ncbi:MAG: hypothetical protein HYY01_05220 [Chloroflexi bacterium]|nr:hypothetical protein [Chloroflexota bacterium]